MSRLVIVTLIYRRNKPIELTYCWTCAEGTVSPTEKVQLPMLTKRFRTCTEYLACHIHIQEEVPIEIDIV
jgi:hypothetical protein